MTSRPSASAGGRATNASGNNATNPADEAVAADEPVWTYREGDAVPPDVTHVRVHPSVTSLPIGAFLNCRLLKEVILPEGLRRIGASAFHRCALLETVNFPSTLVYIGKMAFLGCTSLSAVNLTEGLKNIRRAAFADCRSLQQIALPSTLEDIDTEAFAWCSSLAEVKLTGGILNIKEAAFAHCPLRGRIEIPPRTFVFEGRHRRAGRLVTNGTLNPFVGRAIVVAPERLAYIIPPKWMEIKNAIGTIISGHGTREQKYERVRTLIARHAFSEVSTILELALWKKRMDEHNGLDHGARGECRIMCGADANVSVPNVLSYL